MWESELGSVGGQVADRLAGMLMRFYNGSRGTRGRIISKDGWLLGAGSLRGAGEASAKGKDGRRGSQTRGSGGVGSMAIVR